MNRIMPLAVMTACGGALIYGASPAFTQTSNPPPAGTYVFEAVYVENCLQRREAGWPRVPYLILQRCEGVQEGAELPNFQMTLEPQPNGRFRIRLNNECLTRARDVAFGAPAADMRPCDDKQDQSFSLELIEGGAWLQPFRIRSDNGSCLMPRGGDRNGEEMLFGQCRDFAFRLWRRPWVPGPVQPVPVGRQSFWEEGVDRPGHDIDSFATADDGGAECLRRCETTAGCQALTWIRPSMKGKEAMCYLKDRVPPAVPNPNARSASIPE